MTKTIDEVIEQLKEIAGIENVRVRFYHPPADVFKRGWVFEGEKPRRYVCWDSWNGTSRMGSRVDFVHGNPTSLALAETIALRELVWTIAATGLTPGEGSMDYDLLEQLLPPLHQWVRNRMLGLEDQ